jgi:chemotaxis response regulator CheB
MNGLPPARENNPIRVFVVAAVRLYREGMAYNLERRDGMAVAGYAASRAEAIGSAISSQPDVVVLDMNPSGTDCGPGGASHSPT